MLLGLLNVIETYTMSRVSVLCYSITPKLKGRDPSLLNEGMAPLDLTLLRVFCAEIFVSKRLSYFIYVSMYVCTRILFCVALIKLHL